MKQSSVLFNTLINFDRWGEWFNPTPVDYKVIRETIGALRKLSEDSEGGRGRVFVNYSDWVSPDFWKIRFSGVSSEGCVFFLTITFHKPSGDLKVEFIPPELGTV